MTKRKRKNKQQSQPSPDLLTRLWRDMTLAARLLFDRRMSGTAKMIPLLTAVYILSPVDFIPDFFLPLGVVDDISALLIGLQLFIHSAPPGVVEEYRGRSVPESGPPHQTAHDTAHTSEHSPPLIIEGDYEVRDDRE